jgi:serine/threonine-protein kinase
MLFELLTGNPPFTGDSPVAVAYQHVREDPALPSSLNPDISPELDAIVLKAMAKNPINRYQSAAEMRADLNRAIAGQTVLAEPVMSADERTTLLDTAGDEEEDEGASRKRKAAYAALIIAVLAVLIGGAITAMSLMGDDKPKQAVIPNVENQRPAAATKTLKDKGFTVALKYAVSSEEQKNRVVKQVPGSGISADLKSKVTLTIGQGPNTTTVPPLKGLSLEDAKSALQAANLTANTPITQDSNQPANTVLDSRPGQGETVADGGSVTLIVSTGKISIPSVYGLTEDEARQKLSSQNFYNILTQPAETDEVAPGRVFQQSPAGGTQASTDTQITLTIATAPPTTSASSSAPPSNPSGSNQPSGSGNPSGGPSGSGQPTGSGQASGGQPSDHPSDHPTDLPTH